MSNIVLKCIVIIRISLFLGVIKSQYYPIANICESTRIV